VFVTLIARRPRTHLPSAPRSGDTPPPPAAA
jgi:hypothetical protein